MSENISTHVMDAYIPLKWIKYECKYRKSKTVLLVHRLQHTIALRYIELPGTKSNYLFDKRM